MRHAVTVALVVLTVLGAGCKHTSKKHHEVVPPVPVASAPADAKKDAHFDEVRKSASEQLECPVEQINIVCLRRDSDGECISVRADGCGKSFEYQFGDV